MALHLLNCSRVGGIIGKLSFDPGETLARAVLEGMLDASRFRAGERRAVFSAPGIALGSCGEHEDDPPATPVASNERETIRVVADASITNAAHLRTRLRRLGHAFHGETDAELIAHAYEEWGPRCAERLRGPFAWAVWDGATRRLVLARDHMGLRALYFALLPNHGLAFASELRALLRDPGVGRRWCPEAIDAYLTLGYVPAPLTPYLRISKLEPAHVLVAQGRRLHVEQYWDLPVADAEAVPEERAAALGTWLRTVARRHATDPGGTGILYSGGTSSTALLAAAPRADGGAVMVDVERDAPELARSHAAARHLGRRLHAETATPDVRVLASGLAAHLEEPIADPSALAQFAICIAARRHVDSALAAHGAAALWAGCARHRVERMELAVRAWLGEPIAAAGGHLARPLQGAVRGARALSHLALPPADACAVKHAYGLWDTEHRRAVYTRAFAWEVRDANPFRRHLELYTARPMDDALGRALYVDARTFLPDGAIAPARRAALAAGLELHFPFLECEVVELAARTPGWLKQHGHAEMQTLRQVLSRRLPPALMPPARRRPARHLWLRGALRSIVPSVLLAPRFDGRGIVSRPALGRIWEEHQAGRHDHTHRLWSLVMLELWFREFIDGDAAAEPFEYAARRAA